MLNSLFRAVFYGWITMLVTLLLSTTVLALIIRFSNVQEVTISYVTLIIGLITLFIAGLVAGIKGKTNGWLIGLLTGGGFTLFTFLIQFLGFNDLFSLKQFVFHLTYMLTAMIGSMLGVNFIQLKES